MSKPTTVRPISDYPLRVHENIRFRDLDRLGHVNNAVFATLAETGRVAMFYEDDIRTEPDRQLFVIASLSLQFLAELHWPGKVEIGTGVSGISRSSFTLSQGIFSNGACVALAENVIVMIDQNTRKSIVIPEPTRSRLTDLILEE